MKGYVLNFIDNIQIDCEQINIREQIENIFDDLDNVFTIEFSDEQSMFEIIQQTLSEPLSDKPTGITACNLWEDINFVYTGYYIDIAEKINHNDYIDLNETQAIEKLNITKKNLKINTFASQISAQQVMSAMIIIKQELTYVINGNNISTTMKPCTIKHNMDIIDMIESIFIKDGVVLYVDGTMKKYQYISNPLEHLMMTDREYEKHYVYHEYEVYTHVMIIVADTRCVTDSKLNDTASLLAGKPVKGDVFVSLYKKPEYNENPPYASLSIPKLNDILFIRSRGLNTTGIVKSEKEYVNFEHLIKIEKNKHTKTPIKKITDITGELLNIK